MDAALPPQACNAKVIPIAATAGDFRDFLI
jgi:hypothetical protein